MGTVAPMSLFVEPETPMRRARMVGVRGGRSYFLRSLLVALLMMSSELIRRLSRSKMQARIAGKLMARVVSFGVAQLLCHVAGLT